jgi:hypothetical protein
MPILSKRQELNCNSEPWFGKLPATENSYVLFCPPDTSDPDSGQSLGEKTRQK